MVLTCQRVQLNLLHYVILTCQRVQLNLLYYVILTCQRVQLNLLHFRHWRQLLIAHRLLNDTSSFKAAYTSSLRPHTLFYCIRYWRQLLIAHRLLDLIDPPRVADMRWQERSLKALLRLRMLPHTPSYASLSSILPASPT